MATEKRKHISILGTGKIGLALATLWVRKGHSICLGSRDSKKLQPVIKDLGLNMSVKTIKKASIENDIIVLSGSLFSC